MPTYDYECDACKHAFELYQGINDPVKKKCPECGKQKLRRLLGMGAAVVFKGSGFYQTDYRSESYKKAQAAEKPLASDSSTSKSDGSTSKSDNSSSKSESSSSKAESSAATPKSSESSSPKSTENKKSKKSSE